jgi:hypothetical protein
MLASKFQLQKSTESLTFGINVEPPDFFHTLPCGVAWDGREIKNTDSGTVVALVRQVADDVLIVVDGDAGSLVMTCLLRFLEVANVPDVGYWVAVCGKTTSLLLIEFIIKDKKLLPLGVEDL